MNFEDFLKNVSGKIGPSSAFNLARDARLKALEQILIDKLSIKQEEIDSAVENELKKLADNIMKLPQLPEN